MGEFTLNSTGNEINSALTKVKGLNNTASEINKTVDNFLNKTFVLTTTTLAAYGTKAENTEYDLSNIIPFDGHSYRLQLNFRGRTTNAKEAYIGLFFKTQANGQVYGTCCINQVVATNARQQQIIGNAMIVLGNEERTLKVEHYSGTEGDYELILVGYERLD